MLKVGAFFGGDSSEHDISVITALEAIAAMPSAGVKCIPVYMRDGKWYTGGKLVNVKSYMPFEAEKHEEVFLKGGVLYKIKRSGRAKAWEKLDCALILAHGGSGEDGGLQGLMEINRLPYTSSGVCASAVCMDKFIAKNFLAEAGFPVLEGVKIPREYDEKALENAEKAGYPLFVKPNSQGSSIGAGIARDRRELEEKLALAHEFDEFALVERCVEEAEEYNVGVFRCGKDVLVSEPERPVRASEFLTFDDKYMLRGGGMSGSEREFPAKVGEKMRSELKRLASGAFEAVGADGIVRVDFICERGKIYLNEINTVPGSLAHYLFPEYGYTELLSLLIENALRKGVKSEKIYFTDVLNRGKGKGG